MLKNFVMQSYKHMHDLLKDLFNFLSFRGTNFLVNKQIGVGRMVRRALLHNKHLKTRNGWYSGMVALI